MGGQREPVFVSCNGDERRKQMKQNRKGDWVGETVVHMHIHVCTQTHTQTCIHTASIKNNKKVGTGSSLK
jgi:hypothetical protein